MENFFLISVLGAFLLKNFLHLRTPLLQIPLNFAKIFLILGLSAFLPKNFYVFANPSPYLRRTPHTSDPTPLPTYATVER